MIMKYKTFDFVVLDKAIFLALGMPEYQFLHVGVVDEKNKLSFYTRTAYMTIVNIGGHATLQELIPIDRKTLITAEVPSVFKRLLINKIF